MNNGDLITPRISRWTSCSVHVDTTVLTASRKIEARVDYRYTFVPNLLLSMAFCFLHRAKKPGYLC